jgi:tRNA(fMet)-specific endonuclease VapC
MLDTDAVIALRQGRPALVRKVAEISVGEAVISVVTLGELRVGIEKSSDPAKGTTRLRSLTASFLPVVEMLPSVGEHYGAIRADLERRGETIGPNDLWIAAHARASGLTLVTGNSREFRRVPDLAVENWAAEEAR